MTPGENEFDIPCSTSNEIVFFEVFGLNVTARLETVSG